jgi:glyoxylase-like metal-dependent hydrolase (beta-lactamase superfamily II)
VPAARYYVGSLPITILSDGRSWRDAGAIHGLVPRVMWERVTDNLNDRNQIPIGLNCLLLESGGKTVLIETGQGDKDIATLRERGEAVDHGKLLTELYALGLAPGDIDVVINTHLHSDHCGWNTRLVDGVLRPTFPNARYVIQRCEWDVAAHPNERTRATYLADNLTPIAQSGQLDLIDGETHITPDITVIETPGHTADHASVLIRSGGETALYIGDIVQHRVQLERPAWISAFDVLPLVSLETKKRLIHDAISHNHLIISVHHPFPGVGRIASRDGKNHFIDEPPAATPDAAAAAERGAPA